MGSRHTGCFGDYVAEDCPIPVAAHPGQTTQSDTPATQPQWVHKDGSLCPSWEECDTYEHTSLDGNETIQRIKGSAVPPQFEEYYPYHEDGSSCTHRDQRKCPMRMHYSEFGLSQLGIQPNKKQAFNHEGPTDMSNVRCTHGPSIRSCSRCNPDNPALSCDHGKPWGAECVECGRTDGHVDGFNEQRDGNVGELIDGRVDVYGDPVMGFTRHAQVWSGILGIEVQPWQVALCMLGYKLVRTGITPDYSDNSDDIEGYLDIFRQLMPDMVQARDTAEYLAGGGQGARA